MPKRFPNPYERIGNMYNTNQLGNKTLAEYLQWQNYISQTNVANQPLANQWGTYYPSREAWRPYNSRAGVPTQGRATYPSYMGFTNAPTNYQGYVPYTGYSKSGTPQKVAGGTASALYSSGLYNPAYVNPVNQEWTPTTTSARPAQGQPGYWQGFNDLMASMTEQNKPAGWYGEDEYAYDTQAEALAAGNKNVLYYSPTYGKGPGANTKGRGAFKTFSNSNASLDAKKGATVRGALGLPDYVQDWSLQNLDDWVNYVNSNQGEEYSIDAGQMTTAINKMYKRRGSDKQVTWKKGQGWTYTSGGGEGGAAGTSSNAGGGSASWRL